VKAVAFPDPPRGALSIVLATNLGKGIFMYIFHGDVCPSFLIPEHELIGLDARRAPVSQPLWLLCEFWSCGLCLPLGQGSASHLADDQGRYRSNECQARSGDFLTQWP